MRVRAFAKINRSLRVLGTRADGYHELRTMFQSIGLHDTLTIRAVRGPFRLTCDDPACPTDGTNLIAKAAAAMWTAAGRRGAPRDVAIDLRKRIPMQAGLGGGSSDAAAALRALAKRWRVADVKVRAAAAVLGADVPYFFEGGTALGEGRGDRLVPLPDITPAWVVVTVPGFGVSTKEAFGWWDDAQVRQVGQAGHVNDLQLAVAGRHPIINKLVAALKREGAFRASLSGSGSAVFGLFRRKVDAERASGAMAGRRRRVLMTRTIDRPTYRRLAAK